ncbi:MAG: Purine nucleoside phosphorylase DeoD-type [Acidimicrobiales bacterium]|nr:Purine nucleoside phosphorylase DeoD-type [Acidimicrobiales bacterium]
MADAPILEFDPDRSSLVDPTAQPALAGVPPIAVACFFPKVLEDVCAGATELCPLPSLLPLWRIEWNGSRLAVFYPGQGGPLAAVTLERVIAAGCRTVIACGGAGALLADLELGAIVVVDSAVRDEGTSYHYLPPAREVAAEPSVVAHLAAVAERAGAPCRVAKVWTTDALFRETPTKVQRRREEGCAVVEQEAAALLAVAAFRGIAFGQYLLAGDDCSGTTWDHRGWTNAIDIQHALFSLAADAEVALG